MFGISGKHGVAGMSMSFGTMHPPEGKREHGRRSMKELKARRLWAVGVCLSVVSTEVSKWNGRHAETRICCMVVRGRIGGRCVVVISTPVFTVS